MPPKPQPNAAPVLLLAMLGATFVLLIGGVRLAQRAEEVSIEGDRVALNRLAQATRELLEERQASWHACLTEKAQEYRDAWESDAPLTENRAFPNDDASDQSLLFVEAYTSSDDMRSLSPRPDRELLLMAYRTPERADQAAGLRILHISVHLATVRIAISQDLTVLLDGRAASSLPRDETVRILAPDGSVLFPIDARTEPKSSPSAMLPIRLQWGTWSVAVWDRTETRVFYDRRILIGAASA